jgi:hypothetical protein
MPTVELVEENLKRLAAHQRGYQEHNWARTRREGDKIVAKYENELWFVKEDRSTSFWNSQVRLLTADGGEFLYYVPWQGYFERLRRLSIEVDASDWKVEF